MFRLKTFLKENERRTAIMGVVNCTGDSFSEGAGAAVATALDRALQLLDDGADLLDVGGESTRPGAEEVAVALECERILPVIKELKRLRPSVVISVDSRKQEVIRRAADLGAEIANDVSMLRFSPELAAVAAEYKMALVLSHSRGTPENMRNNEFHDYGDDLIETVVGELRHAREQALAAGLTDDDLIYDPGFGFAKTAEQNWEMLRRIDEFHQLGPVLAGISRKSFLGKFLDQPEASARLGGTVAASLYLAERYVEIIRVHDVRQVADAIKVWGHLRIVG